MPHTLSFSPQHQAACSGAPGMDGSSFRVGNLVQSGSHGIVVAVFCKVRKSLICVKRTLEVFLTSAIVHDTIVCKKGILRGQKMARAPPTAVFMQRLLLLPPMTMPDHPRILGSHIAEAHSTTYLFERTDVHVLSSTT